MNWTRRMPRRDKSQTKPISAGPGGTGLGDEAEGVRSSNGLRPGFEVRVHDKVCDVSRFVGRPTSRPWRARATPSHSRSRSPCPLRRPLAFGPARGGDCAKQTQFVAAGWTRDCRLCETNPTLVAWVLVAKQNPICAGARTQYSQPIPVFQSHNGRDSGIRHRVAAPPPAVGVRQNSLRLRGGSGSMEQS